MKIEKTKLNNGAKIIGVHIPGAETVAIHFGFRTGSRSEPLDVWGVSHFLEHMMFKGSKKRNSTAKISREIDKIGAEYNAFTGKEYTNYYIKTSPENYDLALDVVGDMVTHPIFSEAEIIKESSAIIQESKMYADTPVFNIYFLMEGTLYGKKSPIGKDELGVKKTITAINHRKIADYFQKYYGGENNIIVLAGKLPQNYLRKVKTYQRNLPDVRKTNWESAVFSKNHLDLIYKGTDQAHFGLTVPAYDAKDKKKYTLQVIATILGGYMSSRLFTEIREKRGWAYSVHAFSSEFSDTGYLGVYGGVKKEKVEDSIKIAKEQILNLRKTVTNEEIERAKSHIEGRNALKFEDPTNLAGQIVLSDLIVGEIETPQKIANEIKKVTRKDVHSVCKELFHKEKFYLTIIGPFKDEQKFAKILES